MLLVLYFATKVSLVKERALLQEEALFKEENKRNLRVYHLHQYSAIFCDQLFVPGTESEESDKSKAAEGQSGDKDKDSEKEKDKKEDDSKEEEKKKEESMEVDKKKTEEEAEVKKEGEESEKEKKEDSSNTQAAKAQPETAKVQFIISRNFIHPKTRPRKFCHGGAGTKLQLQ